MSISKFKPIKGKRVKKSATSIKKVTKKHTKAGTRKRKVSSTNTLQLSPTNFSMKELQNMTNSTNPQVRKFATGELSKAFYEKPLSGPERRERAMLMKRKIGLAGVNDVKLNESLLNTMFIKAAKTTKLVGAERNIRKKLNPKFLRTGVKMLPMSGSEPEFVKWLWGAKKKYIEANNCYAYASNQFRFHREHKAQPGENRRKIMNMTSRVPLKCDLLTKAVLRDAGNGAYQCDPNKPCKRGLYKIMMVRAPPPGNEDFHFYRQDKDGTWSHKQGWGYGPTKLDADGKIIVDPRYANRNYGNLNYSIVCSSMCVPKQYRFNI